MGAWGTALFSDDTACDVRDEYIDYIGDGLTGVQATERLLRKWARSLNDQDEAPVFWLALAATQWKHGWLECRVLQNALNVIANGSDLAKWKSSPDYRKRQAVLEKLRATLLSPQPPEKRVPQRFRDVNEWHVGDLITYRLPSERLIIMRVIGHHTDRGGTAPIVELLDWVGLELPDNLDALQIRKSVGKTVITQLMIGRTRAKERPDERLQHLSSNLPPIQKPRFYSVTLWRRLDKVLQEDFGLE
jgi:hypothetical protein